MSFAQLATNPVTHDDVVAAACLKSFRRFAYRAWQEVDPAAFVPNWHVDAVTEHCQAVFEGDIRRLIINIPPGSAKSMLVSVLFPSWAWAKRPSWQLMVASYGQNLANRDADKARTLMRTDWYTHYFRSEGSPFPVTPWDFSDTQDKVQSYKNTAKGHRIATSVGGAGTGLRGDCLIIDDPLKVEDAYSKPALETARRWKDETMSSRFNDMDKACEIVVMQRLHEEDLTGHLLRKGGWEHLCIPAEFELKHRSRTRTWRGAEFWKDPRTQEGEVFFERKFPQRALKALKKSLGSYAYAGQYQQRPAPSDGGILKREWFNRRWVLPGQKPIEGLECRTVPLRFDRMGLFADCTFKKTEDNDFVALGVFGQKGADVFLLRLVWERMTLPETVAAIIDLKSKFKEIGGVYVEDKANGSAVMDVLDGRIPGLIPIEPDGGKESRIHAAAPFIEAGNLWLPLEAAWVSDYITEACSFPKAPHDDAIDMTAYALAEFCGKAFNSVLWAMEQLED